jgi:class 3 adenylate cyclase
MSDETRVGGDELRTRVGELRRLTFMYCDVVGSTELSGRLEPETYRELLRAYRHTCRDIIETRFDGHILRIKGDGALSIFGFPAAHENDAERAVRAGLALVQAVGELREGSSTAGESLELRVGIHHGPVYLDFDEDDIYGLAANVGSRLETLADPGTVVVSDEVRQLVQDHFDLEAGEPQLVKGVAEPLLPFRVVGERAVSIPETATPLVERENELVRLRQAWSLVAAGDHDRAAGIMIRGDAGVGKSRLVAALENEVCRGGVCFLELHGSPFHVDAGFHPVRRLVETRCGIHVDTNPQERLECLSKELTDLGLDLPATIPLLAPVLGIDPSAGYEPATTEGRKLEEQVSQAAFDYVVACTSGAPAILVAEDLHWFDDATRGLLAELMRSGPGNLLIVATSRTPELGSWEAIELRPLTFGGRLELIDALAGGLPNEERLALATRSDGVPLYLEELVRAGAAASAPDSTTPVPGSVPAALYELLVARLYATPDALPVAATAAAAGQEVDRSLLAEAMSISAKELAPTLRDLVDAQIMQPVAGGSRYQFRHELLREVAYELRPPSWRRKVHSRLGDLLSREEVSDWRVLASHFELAERFREAAEAYEHTAEGARRRGALAEARAHLTRAVDLVEHVAEEDGRDSLEVGIRLRRGFLAMLAEGVADANASADFDRCLELVATDPRGDDMVSVLSALWARALSRGELECARHISETLYAGLDQRTEYLRTEVLAGFGMLDWFEGGFDSAIETLFGCTRDLARIEREHELERFWFTTGYPALHMKAHLAIAQFMAGDVAEADRPLDEAIAAGDSMDFPRGPWSANYARWLGSWMWMEEGRFDLAGEALTDLHSSSARHGFDNWEVVAATQDAALDGLRAMRSEPPETAALADHAEVLGAFIELWQMLGLKVLLPFSITTHGALLAAAGDGEGARVCYDDSLALAAETGMRFYDAETMRRIAHLAPDRDQAALGLRAALELAHSQRAQPFGLRIALDLHELVGSEAAPLLEEARRPFEDSPWIADLERTSR